MAAGAVPGLLLWVHTEQVCFSMEKERKLKAK